MQNKYILESGKKKEYLDICLFVLLYPERDLVIIWLNLQWRNIGLSEHLAAGLLSIKNQSENLFVENCYYHNSQLYAIFFYI